NQSIGTPQTWSGTYSVQANCAGAVTINSGGSAALNMVIFGGGSNFLLSGNDATYTYSGNGDTQPTGCSAATFSGVYTFNATGFTLSSTSVNGVENTAGLIQFDGVNKITVNLTTYTGGASSNSLTLTGTYSISSNCLGTATLTDSANASYTMSFSVFT